MDELLFRPIGELASLVRAGEVKARELVEASLRRIDECDGAINAFVEVCAEQALIEAETISRTDRRPFAGVPIAIKNNVPVKGLKYTLGSSFLGDHRAAYDAYVVRRLRAAGFVIVGTTSLPEFGILPTTEPGRFGPTRNPWDTDRTPGGSSGGSSAAVAAGMVPIASANDGGGSTRIPAACTGLIGLKPSRGRVSRGPDGGDSFLVVDGVLTRTVAETAQLLDLLAGYEVGDATWAPRPAEAFSAVLGKRPSKLRIALTTENALGGTPDEECVRALLDAAELLRAQGHEIVEAGPALPTDGSLLGLFAAAFGPAVSLGVRMAELIVGREPAEDEIEPLSRYLYERARAESSVDYLLAQAQLQALARSVIAFFADYDLLMTPALAERPLRIGECDGLGSDPKADFARSGRFTPYTALFNATGQPAITVPVGFGPDDLPTSVQLVAPPLGEDTLLQVAAQLEAACGIGARRPPIATDDLSQAPPAPDAA